MATTAEKVRVTRLDPKLLAKLARNTGKSVPYIRQQISKRASRLGISSEAAQILWAKECGIGTASFQRSLPEHMQEQVRTTLPTIFAPPAPSAPKGKTARAPARAKGRDTVKLATEYLLGDRELKERCADLLRAKGKFDRVVREATTLLDHRLKTLGGITGKMNPTDLVGKVVSPDPKKAILKVSDDPDEQQGFFSICKGLMLAFRNPAHHELTDKFTREDALRFCASIDLVLRVLGQAEKQSPAT